MRALVCAVGLALAALLPSHARSQTVPPWRSYAATGNPNDIVPSTTVATALGTKVDTFGGKINGVPGYATPQEFGFVGNGASTSVADTAAVQAAVNTGRPVDLSYPGSAGAIWVPSTCISLTHPGQEIFGSQRYADGTNQLKIQVLSSFAAQTCPGVFSYAHGEPAPRFHDLGMNFAQPDSASISAYITYPPMISAIGQPRGIMERVGCYGATVCFDLRGNSGGWTFNDVQGLAYKTNADLISGSTYKTGLAASTGIIFRVDGAADTMRWENVHIFPFGATANQQTALESTGSSASIGYQIGRCDGCYIHHSLDFIGVMVTAGNGVYDTVNLPGAAFGSVTDSDFDNWGGFIEAAGEWKMAANNFNMGESGAQAIYLSGGHLSVVASSFGIVVATTKPLVQLNAASGDLVSSINIGNSYLNTGLVDINTINQTNGHLILTGNQFDKTSGGAYANAAVLDAGAGRIDATGNTMVNPMASPNDGAFITVGADGYNRVVGNDGAGYPNSFPASPALGVYANN